jgi:hypothetical protein
VADSNSSYVAIAAVVALVAWRLYSRTRRSFGRQRSSPVRPWITITILSSLTALLVWQSDGASSLRLGLAAGLVGGIALGLVGLRLTKFERASDGFFYTPSAHIGIALTALVIGRLVYRMVILRGAMTSPPQLAQSPLTLALFGMLAGYYVSYAVGLIRWRKRALKDPSPTAEPPASAGR